MKGIDIIIRFLLIVLVLSVSAPKGDAIVLSRVVSSGDQTLDPAGTIRSRPKQDNEPQANGSADQDKRNLRRVDEAADHFMDRLLATLDFTQVWDEMFVSDPAIRAREVMDFWAISDGSKFERLRDVDESGPLRGYLAFNNTFTLGLGAMMRAASLEKPESLDESLLFAGIRDLPEFAAAEKSADGLAELRNNLSSEEFKAVFNRTVPPLERLIPIMRAHLLQHPGEPGVYSSNVAYLKGARGFTRAEIHHGLAECGIADNIEVYAAEALFFRLYFIQTDAGLKLVRILTTFD